MPTPASPLAAEPAARLRAAAPSLGSVRVVAVDGPSAAGKTTYAAELSAALSGAPVVHSDDFPVPWDGDPLAWWPPLTAQVLDPLRTGRSGRFRRYDWHRRAYAGEIEIPAGPFLVIEGVGAARAGAPVALRIWVEAPLDVRRRRAAGRGDDLAAWDRWAANESAHFALDRTRDRSDLVVSGIYPK
jgi:uridine kinase